jgi:hypothetical protein
MIERFLEDLGEFLIAEKNEIYYEIVQIVVVIGISPRGFPL